MIAPVLQSGASMILLFGDRPLFARIGVSLNGSME